MISEVSQTEKDKYCMYHFIYMQNLKKTQQVNKYNNNNKKEVVSQTQRTNQRLWGCDKVCKIVVMEWKIQSTGCKIGSVIYCTTRGIQLTFCNSYKYNVTMYTTILMTESEEELKNLLMKLKEESEKAGLKLNIQKMKI